MLRVVPASAVIFTLVLPPGGMSTESPGRLKPSLPRVHERRGRLLLLAGVGVDGAVSDRELVARSLAEAGRPLPSTVRGTCPALTADQECGCSVRSTSMTLPPFWMVKTSRLKCIPSVMLRFGIIDAPPIDFTVTFRGAAASAGTASAAAATTATAATAARAYLRRVICSFLAAEAAVANVGGPVAKLGALCPPVKRFVAIWWHASLSTPTVCRSAAPVVGLTGELRVIRKDDTPPRGACWLAPIPGTIPA